jgi:transposase
MVAVLSARPLAVSEERRVALERMTRSSSLPHRTVVQAKALLLAADGVSIYETARQLKVASNSVRAWRRRFEVEGVAGVGRIAEGRGPRPSAATAEVEAAVLDDTLRVRPDDGSTHWTTRTMAARHGIGKDTVARIWRKHHLKPWRIDTFKVSNDPHFETKLADVVGLYLNPPAKAIVFSLDEKTQVQALDRTQPTLPMKAGRAGTMTHDYKRHGTTDLFAAMNVATGEVLYDTRKRHSANDVLAFFKLIDLHVPEDLEIHVVLDNLSAHKAPPVATWLDHPRRARWHLHFTPTSSSWLNLVEGWFSLLTKRRLERGVFNSVDSLVNAIETWAEHWNDNPHPFVWTKTAEAILAKARRARVALTASVNGATDH